jgi:magnesium transporter
MQIKKNKNVRWIDVVEPKEADLALLKKTFGLHPLIVEELRAPSARARVEATDDYLFFIYYFPLYDTKDESSVRSEIDIIASKDMIATIHYEPLESVLGNFEVGDAKNSLELLSRIIEHLLVFEERQLRHIREKVEQIGRDVFKNQERGVLERIMSLKRDISEYRLSVRLQEPILKSLLQKGILFWDNDAEVYLNELIGEQMKVISQIQDYREAITDFEETNNQLTNLKINQTIKRLTAISIVVFPALFFEELFTMNVKNTPLAGLPYSFWIVIAIMIALTGSLFMIFKRKNLL